jgi:hypothetical protein
MPRSPDRRLIWRRGRRLPPMLRARSLPPRRPLRQKSDAPNRWLVPRSKHSMPGIRSSLLLRMAQPARSRALKTASCMTPAGPLSVKRISWGCVLRLRRPPQGLRHLPALVARSLPPPGVGRKRRRQAPRLPRWGRGQRPRLPRSRWFTPRRRAALEPNGRLHYIDRALVTRAAGSWPTRSTTSSPMLPEQARGALRDRLSAALASGLAKPHDIALLRDGE